MIERLSGDYVADVAAGRRRRRRRRVVALALEIRVLAVVGARAAEPVGAATKAFVAQFTVVLPSAVAGFIMKTRLDRKPRE